MPFKEVGSSGFGREGVTTMVEEYLQAKTVIIRHTPRDLAAPR
jgi:acyl-CoA reductase-like NAD-dependent aldehyde dehydrogenase